MAIVEILGVQIETSKMTEEELQKLRKEARSILAYVDLEILYRQKSDRNEKK